MARRDDSAAQQQAGMPQDAANGQSKQDPHDTPKMRPEEISPARHKPVRTISDWASI